MRIYPKKPRVYPESGNIHVRRRVKFGIDPTADSLHLGHLVPLLLVKKLNNQGKDLRVVLGTFTATLGDPTGKNKTRPILSPAIVKINAAAIKEQVIKIVGWLPFVENDFSAAHLDTAAFISQVASKFNVAELLARENFQDRSVCLSELLVPLMQALDSVLHRTDIEVGGEDQEINFKLTRALQEAMGVPTQVCLLTPIINGLDGKKMSKSANNCIFLTDPPELIKTKVLGISDTLMDEWLPLFTEKTEVPDDPRDRKKLLAYEILNHLGN